MKYILAVLFAALMAILLVACSNKSDTEDDTAYEFAPPEFIIIDVQEFEPFPEYFETLPGIDNIVLVGNVIYFSSTGDFVYDGFVSRNTRIFTVNADGTNLAELPNYSSAIEVPPEAEGAEFTILAMNIDNDGNLWVAETADMFELRLPPNVTVEDADNWEFSYHRALLGRHSAIRKLDGTGAEIFALDISRFDAEQIFTTIEGFSTDAEGNLYITTASAVYVLDSGGNELFQLDLGNHLPERIISLYDGNVAFLRQQGQETILQKIDVSGRAWGENVTLPSNARNAGNVFSGSGDFSNLFIDNFNLYGINRQSGETTRLLSLIDTFSPDTVENVIILPDGRIMLTNKFWDEGDRVTDLHILTITPQAETTGTGIITVATFFAESPTLQNAAREFNRTSTTHRVEIIDYGRYNREASGGLDRLAMDIITGNAPDIIEVGSSPFLIDAESVPFYQWAARGLFVDLHPFLEADPELNLSDLKENVIRSTEIGGNLYSIFPSFSLATLVGNPSVVGEGMGWNWDEFNAVINANPQADIPMSLFFVSTREEFLRDWLGRSMVNFVDWENGTAHFYRSDFIELLEFSRRFNESPDLGTISTPNLIAAGRTIMSADVILDFHQFKWALRAHGGEVAFKGYPMDNRNGNFLSTSARLAITSQSANKDAAWEFIRIFLNEDFDRDIHDRMSFSTNRAIFDEQTRRALTEEPEERLDGIVLPRLTEAQVQQVLDLIDSASVNFGFDGTLLNIVMESALDFLSGRSSAEDTARVIQSRAGIFMAEQVG